MLDREFLEVPQSLELARRERRMKPIVGDVVDTRPAGACQERRVRHVVEPECRLRKTDEARHGLDLMPEYAVRERPGPSRQNLQRPECAQPPVRGERPQTRKLR